MLFLCNTLYICDAKRFLASVILPRSVILSTCDFVSLSLWYCPMLGFCPHVLMSTYDSVSLWFCLSLSLILSLWCWICYSVSLWLILSLSLNDTVLFLDSVPMWFCLHLIMSLNLCPTLILSHSISIYCQKVFKKIL